MAKKEPKILNKSRLSKYLPDILDKFYIYLMGESVKLY